MRKIFSFLAAVLFAGSMMAAEVTIRPDNCGWSSTAGAQSGVIEGITIAVTNGLASSGQNPDQIRIYKDATLTLSSEKKITKIVFTCTSTGATKYGPGSFAAQDGYSYADDGYTGTWEGEANEVSFTASSAQVRATSIIVTLAEQQPQTLTEQLQGYVDDLTLIRNFVAQFEGKVDGVADVLQQLDTYISVGNGALMSGNEVLMQAIINAAATNLQNAVEQMLSKGQEAWEAELEALLVQIEATEECQQIIEQAKLLVEGITWDYNKSVEANLRALETEINKILSDAEQLIEEALNGGQQTLPDPTNCAEAATAALSVSANNELYNNGAVYTIAGYVTSIQTAWSSQYKNITFWMADTQDGGNVLEAFRAACAAEADAPAVGDKVAVTGSLTKYNTTPEFAAGCTFEILERAHQDTVPVVPAIPDTISVEGAIALGFMLAEGGTSEEEYVVRGYAATTYDPKENGQQIWYMHDTDPSAYSQFEAYLCTPDYTVQRGDYVELKGHLTRYVYNEKTTIEIKNGTAVHVAAPAGVDGAPTVADLYNLGYDTRNNIVLCVNFIDEAVVCKDVHFVGSYNEWSTSFADCPVFEPVSGFEGWYAVQVPYTENAQGKPIHESMDGAFSWEFQCGDIYAWTYVDGNEMGIVQSGISGECDIYYYSAGAYIYKMSYWKNHINPCDKVKRDYTITVYAPDACPDMKPALIGTFNNWIAEEAVPMIETEEGSNIYTLTIQDYEGGTFKVKEASDTDWSNEMLYYVDEYEAWYRFGDFELGEETEIVLNWSDNSHYRFTLCDPYTPSIPVLSVAGAIEIGMALDSMGVSEETYAVEGYVINPGAFSLQYKNQCWYMADDASASASDFQAYNCYPILGDDTLKVLAGDKVQLVGKLKKYYNRSTAQYIIEIEKGDASFIEMVDGDHSVVVTTEEITVAQALEIGAALAAGGVTEKQYKIKGYVSAINVKGSDAYSESYKNQSFYVADDPTSRAASNAEGAFYVYRGKPETEAEIPVGAQVEFTCTIKKYAPASGDPIIENADQNITIKVLSGGEQQLDTISAAQALEIAQSLAVGATQKVVCKAYVASIKTPYSEDYGNITVWLTDDPESTYGDIQAYRAKCSAEDGAALAEHDIVLVEGNVAHTQNAVGDKDYYEFASGAQLTLLEKAEVPVETFTGVFILYAPKGAPDSIEVIGTFDGWNGTAMEDLGSYWRADIEITANDMFKFRQARTWNNEILEYDEATETWHAMADMKVSDYWIDGEEYGLSSEYKVIWMDLTDENKYRWIQEAEYQQVFFAMRFPEPIPANGIQIVGDFAEGSVPMVYDEDLGWWTATVWAQPDNHFTICEIGNEENELVHFDGESWYYYNLIFKRNWSDGTGNYEGMKIINYDLSSNHAWFLQMYFPVVFLDYNSEVLSEQTVLFGYAATAPEAPVREGYVFTGWNTDFSYITGRTFVIAQYSAEGGYSVSYMDGISEGEISYELVDLELPLAPAHEGYTFEGWKVEQSDLETEGIVIKAIYKEGHGSDLDGAEAKAPVRKVLDNTNVRIITDKNTFSVKGELVK